MCLCYSGWDGWQQYIWLRSPPGPPRAGWSTGAVSSSEWVLFIFLLLRLRHCIGPLCFSVNVFTQRNKYTPSQLTKRASATMLILFVSVALIYLVLYLKEIIFLKLFIFYCLAILNSIFQTLFVSIYIWTAIFYNKKLTFV